MASVREGRPLGLIVLVAVCLAIVSTRACKHNRAVNPIKTPPKADAPRSQLTLEQIRHLDHTTFEASLPELREAIERPDQATAERETLLAIAAKLQQADESDPDYWPTVFRFLQFASARLAPRAPSPGQPPRILSAILSVGLMRGIRENSRTILFDEGSFGNSEFRDCRIILTTHPVQMQHVVFQNCAFVLPAIASPSSYLRTMSRMLLSSDLVSVVITSL